MYLRPFLPPLITRRWILKGKKNEHKSNSFTANKIGLVPKKKYTTYDELIWYDSIAYRLGKISRWPATSNIFVSGAFEFLWSRWQAWTNYNVNKGWKWSISCYYQMFGWQLWALFQCQRCRTDFDKKLK